MNGHDMDAVCSWSASIASEVALMGAADQRRAALRVLCDLMDATEQTPVGDALAEAWRKIEGL